MKATQLTQGKSRRLMYVENKSGMIDGYRACIGWVTFSKTGSTVYYRELELRKVPGGGSLGNYVAVDSQDRFWVSGVKRRGSNAHWAERAVSIHIDEDAVEAYQATRQS